MLFPAHAGVILWLADYTGGPDAFPRTRGGDPDVPECGISVTSFSPHTRG